MKLLWHLYLKRTFFVFTLICETLRLQASFIGDKEHKSTCTKEGYFAQHELCEHAIVKAEEKYSIPNRLLLAIGAVESGRSLDMKNKIIWPWTVCANGKSFYCSTKSAAIAIVKRLMSRGIRNIDVGCMQVNLLHHSKAFKNLEEAFTPKKNAEYAARFLSELKETYGSWTCAVGYYHSKVPRYYRPYCTSVYREWTKVKDRPIKSTPKIQMATSDISSKIAFLPSYYSLIDTKISEKLHKLGKQTLSRNIPKFFTKQDK